VRVSLCMIVRNEEANLPTCLNSAVDLMDEIIVVDTGRQTAAERSPRTSALTCSIQLERRFFRRSQRKPAPCHGRLDLLARR